MGIKRFFDFEYLQSLPEHHRRALAMVLFIVVASGILMVVAYNPGPSLAQNGQNLLADSNQAVNTSLAETTNLSPAAGITESLKAIGHIFLPRAQSVSADTHGDGEAWRRMSDGIGRGWSMLSRFFSNHLARVSLTLTDALSAYGSRVTESGNK